MIEGQGFVVRGSTCMASSVDCRQLTGLTEFTLHFTPVDDEVFDLELFERSEELLRRMMKDELTHTARHYYRDLLKGNLPLQEQVRNGWIVHVEHFQMNTLAELEDA